MDNGKLVVNLFAQVNNRHCCIDSCGITLGSSLISHDFHLKKMPTEVGELETRVPSMAYGFTAQRHRNGVLV
ncbi:hypothetical protein FNY09_08825 [Salmonella enterica]|nr:hypothetical protein [Salmonella enterica]EBP3664349.1 hypothetical protein [Salmonella enterica subsp. enterica]EBQ6116295.1 hypothetical protein [Salmonella enterica subsp. enterica serovar Praha]ECI2571952.1 hypothetical protein [Salmonella enterica subsp. enterica serovar Muenchen]ECM2064358.1 hypothetical protein [Salmonella enterica subsp. enterica serovar Kentucky]